MKQLETIIYDLLYYLHDYFSHRRKFRKSTHINRMRYHRVDWIKATMNVSVDENIGRWDKGNFCASIKLSTVNQRA